MHQFPYAFKWLLTRGSFYFNLPSQYREKWWCKLGLLVSRISSLYDRLTIHPNESTWLSINIGFGRVHQWVGNGPITISIGERVGDIVEFRCVFPLSKISSPLPNFGLKNSFFTINTFTYKIKCIPKIH